MSQEYKVIVNNVISAVLLNDKLYYYRLTDEVANEVGTEFSTFNDYDINTKEERVIEEKIILQKPPVLYKNKIYYGGAEEKFIEFDPDTMEKKSINVTAALSYRYSDSSIYAKGANFIEKSNLTDNSKIVIMAEADELYYISEMNVTKNYIFFLAQDTKEKHDEIYRLNLYRMKKDGSELKKIYFSDYTRDIIFAEHYIYDLGDKLLLYERNDENFLTERNKFQLIDYDGNELDSTVINTD